MPPPARPGASRRRTRSATGSRDVLVRAGLREVQPALVRIGRRSRVRGRRGRGAGREPARKPTRGSCGRGSRPGSLHAVARNQARGSEADRDLRGGHRVPRWAIPSQERSSRRVRSVGPRRARLGRRAPGARRARRHGGPRVADGGARRAVVVARRRPRPPVPPRAVRDGSSSASAVAGTFGELHPAGARRRSTSRGGSRWASSSVDALLAGTRKEFARPRRPAVPARPAGPGVRRAGVDAAAGEVQHALGGGGGRAPERMRAVRRLPRGAAPRGHQEPRLHARLPGSRPHAHRARRPIPSSSAIVARLRDDFGAELRAG